MTAYTATASDKIAELLLAGHTIDYACEKGLIGGWGREAVLTVVMERSWHLDASGRIPLRDRPRRPAPARTLRGRRKPVAHGQQPPADVGAELLEQTPATTETPTERTAPDLIASGAAGTAPDPSGAGHGYAGPDAQPQVSPSRSSSEGTGGGLGASDAPAAPPAAPPTPVDVLAVGLAHPHPAVRAKAKLVMAAVDALCAALAQHPAERPGGLP